MPDLTESSPRKYTAVAEYLRQQVRGGHFKVGTKLTSFSELQKQFGVTTNTVNRALIELQQEGLIERRRGSGIYVAGPVKRVKGTRQLGVAGFGFNYGGLSTYWTDILDGAREAAQRYDAQLSLLDYKSSRGWEKIDGLLLCDWSGTKTLPHVPPTIPCVSLLVPVPTMTSVHSDDYASVRTATEYLLSLGHTRIAFLRSRDTSLSKRRVNGYEDALRAAGITPVPQWQRTLPSRFDFGARCIEAGQGAMNEWLSQDWDALGCTALLAHNDEVAIGVIEVLQQAGISVPGEISVMGFDGLPIGRYFVPRLTTIEVPLRELGFRATELLLQQIAMDTRFVEQEIIAARLEVGDSTAPPRVLTHPKSSGE